MPVHLETMRGDVFFVDFFFEHALAGLAFHLLAQLGEFFFGLADQAVADFGDALQIAFALFGLLFGFQLFDFALSGRGRGR